MKLRWMALSALGALSVVACETTPSVHVEKSTVAMGEDVVVVFDERLSGRATNQYWIALQPADAPTSDTSDRVILQRMDQRVRLRASRPGDFEVRLHGQYPKQEQHVLVRIPIRVEGWQVKTGIEQLVDPTVCLDRWLADRRLDPYGSPEGTVYPGDTPLLDEATGKSVSRWEYVIRKHPEVRQACDSGRPESP